MKKIATIPTFVGILFLIIGISAGIFLLGGKLNFRSGAEGQSGPKDVRISNVSDSSFVVSWVTDIPTRGFVKYSTDSSFNKTAQDSVDGPTTTHYVALTNLSPSTNYFFKINSQGSDFDSDGSAWTSSTGTLIGAPEFTVTISGTVEDENHTKANRAIVFAQIPGASAMSAVTTESGSYLISLSQARVSPGLSAYTPIDAVDTLVEIFVQGASGSIATAKVLPQSGNPTPPITLGQVHDFTDEQNTAGGNIPTATIDLPPDQVSTPASKFTIATASGSGDSPVVTLESHKEGEVVTTTTPEFFGEGPVGTTITIVVESDPQTDTVKIPSSGDWKWDPPVGLEPGTHKITISWRDVQGILRTLTRSFVVQAAEGPSFVSTPSATLNPTATPTPTPTPSATLNPTATPTTVPTATASSVPIPISGTLTPTIMLFMMGIGLIILSLFIGFVLT